MTVPSDGLEACERRLRVLLPDIYKDNHEAIQPVPMGSAGLRFDADGRLAWNEMWGSFCDLAMAGGPPHKGSLLEPGTAEEIAAAPDRYDEVVAEVCRGIHLVTGLFATQSRLPGWVRVDCTSAAMAAWLQRAITMENVSVSSEGLALWVPAGPAYRLEREIKNVITVVAKSCHYWMEHMAVEQHDAVGEVLRAMDAEWHRLEVSRTPWAVDGEERRHGLVTRLKGSTSLVVRELSAAGWVGVEMPDVRSAVWLMRILAGLNVLARREQTTLCLPVSDFEGNGTIGLVERLRLACGWATERGMLAGAGSAGDRQG